MVKVEHEGRMYALTTVDESPIWVDNRNIIVPVVLQNYLRAQALLEGADQSVFNVKKKSSAVKKPEAKRVRKKKESLGVKLF